MKPKSVISVVLNNFTNDSRVLKQGFSLKTAGYDVQIVALHENDLMEYERVDGLSIHRVKLQSRKWPKWKLVQLLKYFEFLFRTVKKYKNKADVVHCHDLDALPVGVLIKKLSKRTVKIIYDAHEYETEVNGLKGMHKQIVKRLERFLIGYVDQVITVSDSIANEYQKLYSIPKPKLVLNCPLFEVVKKKNFFRRDLNIRQEQAIFLYQGMLSYGRGIEILLEAFASFEEDKSVLVCMGYGPLEKLIEEKAKQYSTIFFYPAVSPEDLLDYTSSADYGVSFIEDTCLSYRYCLPNKLFEYFMAELPVIVSNLFEMKSLVEHHQLGLVVNDNNIEGLVKAITASLDMDYKKIKANVGGLKKEFCWEAQEKILLGLYGEL